MVCEEDAYIEAHLALLVASEHFVIFLKGLFISFVTGISNGHDHSIHIYLKM